MTLIQLSGVKKHFRVGKKLLRAVDGVDLTINSGEVVGLVGESGCGKSTLGRTLLRLDRLTEGSVRFDGKELYQLNPAELKQYRREVQTVFQDPYASLNPRMTVVDIVGEPLVIHGLARGRKLRDQVEELLYLVGLDPEVMQRFPHEFSGGQRQRIGIARALATRPRFLVCDEPISALDLSIQAQIINLLKRLQREMKLTYLFIAHDLAMVRHVCDRVAVMYLGRIVEEASTEQIFSAPQHPYTQALLSAVLVPDPLVEKQRSRLHLFGDPPSPISPPSGCPFHKRCPKKLLRCEHELPALLKSADGHQTACHLVQPDATSC